MRPIEAGRSEGPPEFGAAAPSSTTSRPRKKRVLTEARKEQNRLAQRVFRQKQKHQRQQEKARLSSSTTIQKQLRPRLSPISSPTNTTSSIDSGNDGSFAVPELSWSDAATETCTTAESVDNTGEELFDMDTSTDILDSLITEPGSSSSLESLVIANKTTTPLIQPPGMGLADPHRNAIQLLPTTIFSAVLHNALSLGFDLASLGACGPEYISPFYRPTTPADEPSAILASIMSSLSPSPPENLVPTLTQVLIPHHASLDLIPLPQLRERAIVLSAAMPEVFNVWELKLDIYARGGLTVWRRRRSDSRGSGIERGSSCQPWDKSSWEAAPWFLRKWSMAVDGEDGELGKQSRWWRALRGAEDDDRSSLAPPT